MLKIPLYKKNRWIQKLDFGDEPVLIVGDIHGCMDEFTELMDQAETNFVVHVGDLADRGPCTDDVLDFFMTHDWAYSVMGNHDHKLLRYLTNPNPKMDLSRGLTQTLKQIRHPLFDEPHELPGGSDEWFIPAIRFFLENLPLVIETSQFRVVHGAYIPHKFDTDRLIPQSDSDFLAKCIYGETNGEKDAEGYPVRSKEWINNLFYGYSGDLDIIHGHTPCNPCPDITPVRNKKTSVYNIDGGCCFGGSLVGIRYPDKQVFKVKAKKQYWESRKDLE